VTVVEYLISISDMFLSYEVDAELQIDEEEYRKNSYTSLTEFIISGENLDRYDLSGLTITIHPDRNRLDITLLSVKDDYTKQDKKNSDLLDDLAEIDFTNLPWLIREKTGEYIYIIKDNFVIGKSKLHADYAVENNTAISREHCTFIRAEKLTYLRDEHSTNGTYVDGTRLDPGRRVLLSDGMRINLANERFIFKCKR